MALGKPEIAHLFFFGSRVRGITRYGGPVRPDSDLDIAIEPDPVLTAFLGAKALAGPMA